MLISINPTTSQVIAEYAPHTPQEITARLERAERSFRQWRGSSFADRAALLQRVARELRARRDELAILAVSEMGKLLVDAKREVEKCAMLCDYIAEHGELAFRESVRKSEATRSYIAFRPLGVILGIMPWNFPYWQAVRFLAPAIAAGNTALLKHASNVTGCALALEGILRTAGAAEGLFQTILVQGAEVLPLIDDSRIVGVSLTGSESAGRMVGERCGRNLKPCVLELGGSDPFIVLEDANLDTCVKEAVAARLMNNGQSCVAAKRFIVHERILDSFLERFSAAFSQIVIGDPLEPNVQLGPLAKPEILSELDSLVAASLKRGARGIFLGELPTRSGSYCAPRILFAPSSDLPICQEETFGPVAAVIAASDERAMIDIANSTRFGLGASVWSEDSTRAEGFAEQIVSGLVFVNGRVQSDPRLPFGGVRASGFGRELTEFGMREFTNIQTVWVR